jgi:hypothetical protein
MYACDDTGDSPWCQNGSRVKLAPGIEIKNTLMSCQKLESEGTPPENIEKCSLNQLSIRRYYA